MEEFIYYAIMGVIGLGVILFYGGIVASIIFKEAKDGKEMTVQVIAGFIIFILVALIAGYFFSCAGSSGGGHEYNYRGI